MISTEQKTNYHRLQRQSLIFCAVVGVGLGLLMIALVSVGMYQTHNIAGVAVIPLMVWSIFSIIKNTKRKLTNL